jgi:hypothetical protein
VELIHPRHRALVGPPGLTDIHHEGLLPCGRMAGCQYRAAVTKPQVPSLDRHGTTSAPGGSYVLRESRDELQEAGWHEGQGLSGPIDGSGGAG